MTAVVALTLAAALCNAVSSVLQKQGVQGAPGDHGHHGPAAFAAGLVRHPVWLLGILALVGSFLLQAAALARGELATVQPCLVAELLFVLAILVVWFGQRLGRQEWLGAAGLAAGVVGFLVVGSPSGGRAAAPAPAWLVAGLVVGAIVVANVALGRSSYGSRPAVYFGTAAAAGFALTAALVKGAVTTLVHQGLGGLLSSWMPYALVATGAAAVLLSAKAFQRGSIAAAQAALSGVDPLASIVIGVVLFGEHLRAGAPAVCLEMLSLVVMVAGVVVLSRSPLVFRAERLPPV